jgi:hypothetical protein
MFLLHLPVWAYVVFGAIVIAAIGALPRLVKTRHVRRENRYERRPCCSWPASRIEWRASDHENKNSMTAKLSRLACGQLPKATEGLHLISGHVEARWRVSGSDG